MTMMTSHYACLLRLLAVAVTLAATVEADTNSTSTSTWSEALNAETSPENNNNNNSSTTTTSATPRIVGGELARPREFPWYVASTEAPFLCGGALVHPLIVASAAHCAGAFPIGGSVYVGAYILDSDSGGAQRRTIRRRLVHPNYQDELVWNDFVLLLLNEPVDNPVLMDLDFDPSQPSPDDTLTTMGFGNVEEDGDLSLALQKVDVFPVSFDSCEERYAAVLQYPLKPDIQMCAAYPGGGRDACQGDSGGPLINSQGKQVGIVSVGFGCARESFPGIYSRISGAKDFFQSGICTLARSSSGGDDVDLPGYCDDIPTQSPPSSSGNVGAGVLKIVVGYDFYVDETTWEITQGLSVLYEGPQYDPEPYKAYETIFSDVPVGTYTFTIYDSACDGLSSLFGDGFFEIWWIPEGNTGAGVRPSRLLAKGDHLFSCSDSVSFTIPGDRRFLRRSSSDDVTAPSIVAGFENAETVSSSKVTERLIASPKLATVANPKDVMELEDAYKRVTKTSD